MPIRRDSRTGKWFWRKHLRLADGTSVRRQGGGFDTKEEAARAERDAVAQALQRAPQQPTDTSQ
jgi:hypothetical protein